MGTVLSAYTFKSVREKEGKLLIIQCTSTLICSLLRSRLGSSRNALPPPPGSALRDEPKKRLRRRLFNMWCHFFSVPPKLNINLGSSVSSVSDPDVSGMSDKGPAEKDTQQKAAKEDADDSHSEGNKNTAFSIGHFLVALSLILKARLGAKCLL